MWRYHPGFAAIFEAKRNGWLGEIFLALLRGLLYATGFTAVMGVMGLITTWWAILVIPAVVARKCCSRAATGLSAQATLAERPSELSP